jgi:hypothetical protein
MLFGRPSHEVVTVDFTAYPVRDPACAIGRVVTTLECHDFEVIFAHSLRLRSSAHTSRVAAHHN